MLKFKQIRIVDVFLLSTLPTFLFGPFYTFPLLISLFKLHIENWEWLHQISEYDLLEDCLYGHGMACCQSYDPIILAVFPCWSTAVSDGALIGAKRITE